MQLFPSKYIHIGGDEAVKNHWQASDEIQAQLWSEYIPNPQHLEYMAYPRAAALAEVGWSPKSSKDYDHFLARLGRHLERLKTMQLNYRVLD